MADESLSPAAPDGKEELQRFVGPFPLSAHYIQQRPEQVRVTPKGLAKLATMFTGRGVQ